MSPKVTNSQLRIPNFSPSQIITDPVELIPYEIDATTERATPDAVVFPHSTEQVAQIVRWAVAEGMPLVARGAGTGLSGGSIAEKGGIIVEFSHMNRVLELDTAGRSVVVEPGLVNLTLDSLCKREGLYYPPDPASGRSATIGGNIAENAGGPHCFKYGVTTNYITGLQVVPADGRIIHFGGRALDYPEYDFVGLLNGSEGTLGIITRAEARLLRNPPGVKTMVCAFDSVEQAGRAVSAVIAAGLVPATMEMMDQNIMRIVEDFVHAGLPTHRGALLIVEVDGYPASLDTQMNQIVRTLEANGAVETHIAQSAEERDRLWYGRKSAAGAMARLAPAYFLVDGTVPRSRLAETLRAVREICERLDLKVGFVFHAGDGNLHPFIPMFPSDPAQVQRGWQACGEIMRAVVEREGSITGEHGVGIEKREFMPLMYDGAELAAMMDIKQVFDPKNVLNPGKVFPKVMPEVNRIVLASSCPTDSFSPRTAEEAAAGLAALSAAGCPVVINEHREGAVTCSTQNLCGIIRYAPEDLYITVGAGTRLSEVQDYLGKEGKQLALASPWPDTTIGGLISSNLNSPQRMRYGAVRDQLLCCSVALADGRVIRAGRALVKNVAGYDLPKVFVGSQGTLGLIVDATFKWMPLPRARETLLIPVDELTQGMEIARQLLRVAFNASGLGLTTSENVGGISSRYVVAYSAEGSPEQVAIELDEANAVLSSFQVKVLQTKEPSAVQLWQILLHGEDATQVRVGVPAKELADYVKGQSATLEQGRFLADIANGLVYAVNDKADVQSVREWVSALRQPALMLGGYAVVTHSPDAMQGNIDPMGYQPESLDLMRALKARWDPKGILNPSMISP